MINKIFVASANVIVHSNGLLYKNNGMLNAVIESSNELHNKVVIM